MIKFKCFLDNVANDMPIVHTKDIDFDWIQRAKEYYSTTNRSSKTTSCPGIFSIVKAGWIHRSYQDIKIQTNGDGYTFNWETRIDQKETKNGKYIQDYVSYHDAGLLSDFYNLGHNTLKTVIKIQSPWFVEIPKGYSLLLMPVAYSDDNRFTAASGLLKGNQFLNVQLYWHRLNSTEMIAKGTPLNQMLLIQDETVYHEIETVEDVGLYLKENFNYFDKY